MTSISPILPKYLYFILLTSDKYKAARCLSMLAIILSTIAVSILLFESCISLFSENHDETDILKESNYIIFMFVLTT
jgi:hypothetical protein